MLKEYKKVSMDSDARDSIFFLNTKFILKISSWACLYIFCSGLSGGNLLLHYELNTLKI